VAPTADSETVDIGEAVEEFPSRSVDEVRRYDVLRSLNVRRLLLGELVGGRGRPRRSKSISCSDRGRAFAEEGSPRIEGGGELPRVLGAGVFVLDIQTPSTSIPRSNARIPKGISGLSTSTM
jgi:hypothetical protein